MEPSMYTTLLLLLTLSPFLAEFAVMHKKITVTEVGLQAAVNELREGNIPNINILEIKYISEDFLPSGLFDGLNISQLVLRNMTLFNLASDSSGKTYIGSSPFKGLEKSLQTIVFSISLTMENWNWGELSVLKNLNTIVITRSTIATLPKTFSEIKGVPIKRLFVTANPINNVADGCLDSFSDIEEVSFEGCKIKTPNRKMFPKEAKSLKIINLSSNEITTLDSEVFDDMPALERVDLEHNSVNVHDAQHAAFEMLHLVYLGLYRNPETDIRCYKGMKWLIKNNAHYKREGKTPYYEDGVRPLKCSGPKYRNLVKDLIDENDLPSHTAEHVKPHKIVFMYTDVRSFYCRTENLRVTNNATT